MASFVEQENASPLPEADAELRGLLSGDLPINIDFDPTGDPDNPLEWPAPFKWSIVALLAFTSFTVTFSCISIAPVASRIVNDLDGDNGVKSVAILLVTIWELGEAVGPFLIAPLSEMFGRYPLINASNLLFIATTAVTALSRTTTLVIVMRALTGMVVASSVLNPAIIGDIFEPEQRGKAMSVMMFATVIGGAVGPAFGGVVTEKLGWRAVPWMSVGLASVGQLLYFIYFRETYKVSILQRRMARLQTKTRKATSNGTFTKEIGLEVDSLSIRASIMRPAAVLFSSAVLAALSIFGSSIFAYFYIVAVTLPSILEDKYGLSAAAAGAAFLVNRETAMITIFLLLWASQLTLFLQAIGSFTSVVVGNLCLDKIYVKRRDANNGIGLPEYRLPLTIIGAFMLPPAVILYGWCAEYNLPLTLLLLAVIWIRLSLMLAFMPLMAYVVDACGLYAASALTGVVVTRCLAGAFLPITTTLIIDHLGYGWGFTVLGALSLTLAIIPLLILRFGDHWRQRSKYTRTRLE